MKEILNEESLISDALERTITPYVQSKYYDDYQLFPFAVILHFLTPTGKVSDKTYYIQKVYKARKSKTGHLDQIPDDILLEKEKFFNKQIEIYTNIKNPRGLTKFCISVQENTCLGGEQKFIKMVNR